MKQSIFIASLILFASCGKGTPKTTPTTDSTKTTTSETPTFKFDNQTICFEKKQTFTGKDAMDMTTTISISTAGAKVTGTYIEERLVNGGNVDGAAGDMVGTRRGDTLFLDLTYTIEGSESTEETVWLLEENKLTQNLTEIEADKNGKMVIKDRSKYSFSEVFNKVACK